MMRLRLIFLSLGLALTAACTTVRPVEIPISSEFREHCKTEPAVLSDAEAQSLGETTSAEDRERNFWAPRDQGHRDCTAYERDRADSILRTIDAFNASARSVR